MNGIFAKAATDGREGAPGTTIANDISAIVRESWKNMRVA